MNNTVAMMNTGAIWWRKCSQLSSAKTRKKLRVALKLGVYWMLIRYLVSE